MSTLKNLTRVFRARRLGVVLPIAMACLLTGHIDASAAIATYRFTAGWATFGISVPQGQATDALQIGSLPTQTDVKTRWPDGSVRFAVVTAHITSTGTYPINGGSQKAGTFTPTWPSASVSFVIAGITYTAVLPSFSTSNTWLSGALVKESRVVEVPTAASAPHPLLQVLFDVRAYSDGQHRLDVSVQNVRDVALMDRVAYDLTVSVAGQTVLAKSGMTQYGYTRWRKTFGVGLSESDVTPDFEPFFLSGALPRFLPAITNQAYDTSSPAWGINGFGTLNPIMESGGYRPELSPFPEWQARYIVHKTATQRQATLLSGNNSGSWSMHITRADGVSLIKVTDPGLSNYWFDTANRYAPGSGPAAPARSDGSLRGLRQNVKGGFSDIESSADAEHLPNLTYLPYLLTGDRYYLDQTKLWAAWAVLNFTPRDPVVDEPIFEPNVNRSRRASQGLVWVRGLSRELGHPFTVLIMAAAIAPDADADKSYFVSLVQNQLDALGEYISRAPAGGVAEAIGWEGWNTINVSTGSITGKYFSPWRLSYSAFAVDFADQQAMWTLGGASEFRNRIVRSTIGFIENGVNSASTGAERVPSYPAIARVLNGQLEFFTTWRELLEANHNFNFQGPTRSPGWDSFNGPSMVGYHGVEAFITVGIGRRLGLSGADAVYRWLAVSVDPTGNMLLDLAERAGYAVAIGDVSFIPRSQNAPSKPTNVRITR